MTCSCSKSLSPDLELPGGGQPFYSLHDVLESKLGIHSVGPVLVLLQEMLQICHLPIT